MKTAPFIILLIFFTCLIGCSQNNSSEQEINTYWKNFLKTVSSKNFKEFKRISLPKIHCKECFENTEEEKATINSIRLTDPETWNNRSNDELIISVDTFIKRDFDIVFDKTINNSLKKTSSKSFIIREFEDYKQQDYLKDFLKEDETYQLYEIVVTTETASTQSPAHGKLFQILRTNKGFKLYGISNTKQ